MLGSVLFAVAQQCCLYSSIPFEFFLTWYYPTYYKLSAISSREAVHMINGRQASQNSWPVLFQLYLIYVAPSGAKAYGCMHKILLQVSVLAQNNDFED